MKPRNVAIGVAFVATSALTYMIGTANAPQVEVKQAPTAPQVQVQAPRRPSRC